MLGRAVVAALVLWSADVSAQQLDFGRVTRSGDELLTYRWRDHDKREHTTAFTLARQVIKDAEKSFLEFNLDAMWHVVESALRDEVRKFGDGATIKITRRGDEMNWSFTVRDQSRADVLSKRLTDRVESAQKSYLAEHLRRKVDDRRIMVDFSAATQAMQVPMRAVARALGETKGVANTDRARIELALAFFQDIPYAVLEDKKRRGGDFLPPPALLAQNRGDCDSKAVALAAVLRTYAPSRRLAMVTMPDHAVLAVDLAAEPGDATVRAQGRQFVILEVAGPAMLPVGRVGTQSAKYLAEGRNLEIWPLY